MKVPISNGELAMPVQRLIHMEGNCMGGSTSLLVFGGQVLDQPDSLSIVSLDALPNVSSHSGRGLGKLLNTPPLSKVPSRSLFRSRRQLDPKMRKLWGTG